MVTYKNVGIILLILLICVSWGPVLSYGASLMFVDDSGNVGIGNGSPLSKLDVTGAIYSRLATTTATVDWNEANIQEITLNSASTTLSFQNGHAGGEYKLILNQDAIGGRVVSWPASVKWEDGSAPVLTSAATSTDMVTFVYDGTNYLGSYQINFSPAVNLACTGGTITTSGGYTIHTFTSSGVFDCTNKGSKNVNYLVVGGGGGGAGSGVGEGTGGGGGAGGVLTGSNYAIAAQSYSINVGSGGSGGSGVAVGNNGGNSLFSTITAYGGGGGGIATPPTAAGNGGSGGGAGHEQTSHGTGITGQGNDGGNGGGSAAFAGGGGGGAGSGGANATGSNGANGGNGVASSISGTSVTYGGGGGSGVYTSGSHGNGGSGGGGDGGAVTQNGSSGSANTGGGGGSSGGNASTTGGSGGSGIVIISYPTP